MNNHTPEPAPVPDLPCAECGRPRVLELSQDTAAVACAAPACSNVGISVPLWWAIDRAVAAGAPDRCPAGWPRPRHQGLAIPWTTPVTAAGAWWRLLHRARLAACQLRSLCQVCGQELPESFYVVVDADGLCLTSGGLHQRCATLTRGACPAARRDGVRAAAVSPTDLIIMGEVLPELGQTQRWAVAEMEGDR